MQEFASLFWKDSFRGGWSSTVSPLPERQNQALWRIKKVAFRSGGIEKIPASEPCHSWLCLISVRDSSARSEFPACRGSGACIWQRGWYIHPPFDATSLSVFPFPPQFGGKCPDKLV